MYGPRTRPRGLVHYMTLYETIDTYLENRALVKAVTTMKGEMMDLRLLCLYLRNPVFAKITDTDIVKYLRTLISYGWTQNGTYKKAIVFRSFWKFCNQKKFTTFDYNLIPIVKKEFKPPRVATIDQYKKILSVIPLTKYMHIRNRAIITLLKHGGMRAGEVVAMNIDTNFDTKNRTAIIKTEKSRGMRPFRQVFWTDTENEAADALEKWLKVRQKFAKESDLDDPDALFIGFNNMGYGRRITGHTVAAMFKMYSKKANIPNLNAHSLRHMFAHDVVKQGGSNSDIMNLLGHSKLESSSIYTVMYGEELKERYLQLKIKKE